MDKLALGMALVGVLYVALVLIIHFSINPPERKNKKGEKKAPAMVENKRATEPQEEQTKKQKNNDKYDRAA